MAIFDKLGQQAPQTASQRQINPMQMMQQLRANPAAMLKQVGLSIPDGMNDPQKIVNHLLQSGQVPQGRYQQAMQMLSRMGRR
jgi:hypothetical protein